MRDRQTCIDCGKQSPETETNYTLISAQFGWRLARRRSDNGDFIVEWRCPECWRAHKQKLDDAASAPTGTQAKTLPEKRTPPPPSGATRSSRPPATAARTSSKPPTGVPPRTKRG